jgi:hypothetical protein
MLPLCPMPSRAENRVNKRQFGRPQSTANLRGRAAPISTLMEIGPPIGALQLEALGLNQLLSYRVSNHLRD